MTPAERESLLQSSRPFGAHVTRPAWPLALLGTLLALWSGVLLWMLLSQAGA